MLLPRYFVDKISTSFSHLMISFDTLNRNPYDKMEHLFIRAIVLPKRLPKIQKYTQNQAKAAILSLLLLNDRIKNRLTPY